MNTQIIVTIICSCLASSGLWALISKLIERKDEVRALRRIAIGLRRAFRRAEMNTVPQQSKTVGWISFALVSMRIFESLPFSGDITPTFSLP